MPRSLDVWYALSPGARAGYGLLLMVGLVFLVWWWQVQPVTREQAARKQQHLAQQADLLASWRKILALKPPEMPLAISGEPTAFSPLDVHSRDAQLIRWHPAQNGGEMVLEAKWVSIPQTFSWLAARQMLAPAFSIIAQGDVLHFTLQLESDGGS